MAVNGRVISAGIIGAGTIFCGWLLMKTTVPTHQQLEEKMADDLKSDKVKRAVMSRNEQMMMVVKENAKSNRPAWDVKGIEDLKKK